MQHAEIGAVAVGADALSTEAPVQPKEDEKLKPQQSSGHGELRKQEGDGDDKDGESMMDPLVHVGEDAYRTAHTKRVDTSDAKNALDSGLASSASPINGEAGEKAPKSEPQRGVLQISDISLRGFSLSSFYTLRGRRMKTMLIVTGNCDNGNFEKRTEVRRYQTEATFSPLSIPLQGGIDRYQFIEIQAVQVKRDGRNLVLGTGRVGLPKDLKLTPVSVEQALGGNGGGSSSAGLVACTIAWNLAV